MTRVLPLPAPANTKAGPSRYRTASRCLSFKFGSNTAISTSVKCLKGQLPKHKCGAFFEQAALTFDPKQVKTAVVLLEMGFLPKAAHAHDRPPEQYAKAQDHILKSFPSLERATTAMPIAVLAVKNLRTLLKSVLQ